MSVAEGAGNSFKDAHDLVDANRNELNMAYAFEGVDIAKASGYSLVHFKEVFSRWDSAFANNGWLSIFLANHDQARMVTRFGNDSPAYREKSSTLLTTFIMTMRGTPYYYNGDELGMTNAYFTDIKQYKDMPTLNEYQFQLKQGADMNLFMKKIQFECRDNGRTPFQWDSSLNAGFTTGTPWLSINPNYKTINKATQDKDPNSILNYFRKIVAIRKSNPILVHGKYSLLDKQNPTVYAYTREWQGKKWLILLNFSTKESSVNIGFDYRSKTQIINNYNENTTTDKLRPYEAVVYEL